MDVNELISGAIEKAATDQIKDKAVEIAGEAAKKIFSGKDEEGDDKKDSGFDVGGIIKNVTAGNDDSGGGLASTIGSIFK